VLTHCMTDSRSIGEEQCECDKKTKDAEHW
jgi:hypothetical protein